MVPVMVILGCLVVLIGLCFLLSAVAKSRDRQCPVCGGFNARHVADTAIANGLVWQATYCCRDCEYVWHKRWKP